MPPRKRPARKPPIKPPPPKPDTTPCPPPQVTETNIRQAGVALSLVFVAICLALVASRGCEIDLTPDPVDPQPDPTPPVVELDLVDKTFDTYERLFREAQGTKAEMLRDGKLTSEQAGVDWFKSQDIPKQAFADLLKYEADQFGGEKWTAEAEAAISERWATGGQH